MPILTVTHEAPLELIRQHPDLAVDLVRAMTGVLMPDDVKADLGPTSLNAVVPAEFTADSVVVVTDKATKKPALVIVVEPQGRDDRTKAYSWPAYLANVREAVQCPRAVLIVVCPDPREAEKCRQVIPMGHPGWDLWPVVIDPLHAPDAAGADPYLILFLACLPALDMESEAGARQVLAAIRDTGASHANRKRLTAIILKRASDAARQILEDMMSTAEWKDDFIESYVQIGIEQGREQGIEQGLEQGIEQGIEQGAASAKAQDVLKVMDARGLRPTREQRAKVTATVGVTQLDLWFDRALTAGTAADVFKDPSGE
ncbi:MAG: hypothetical protein ACRDOI_15880 [Trebonia sp.]